MDTAVGRNLEYLERPYTRAVELGVARERDYEQAEREQTARARGYDVADAGARDASLLDGYDAPHRAVVLVAFATARLGHVALEVARLDGTETTDDPTWELALVAARDTASNTLGLAHLALQAYAQAVGYHASPWVGHAPARRAKYSRGGMRLYGSSAACAGRGGRGSLPAPAGCVRTPRARATLLATDPDDRHATDELAQHTRRAAFALSAAARAIRDDRMRVADELAAGLGQVLVVFAITSEAQPV